MDLDRIDELARRLRTFAVTGPTPVNDVIEVCCAVRDLVELARGLREEMYGDEEWDGEDSRPVWNPDMPVNGGDLVEWVGEEMKRLGLVPKPGPRA